MKIIDTDRIPYDSNGCVTRATIEKIAGNSFIGMEIGDVIAEIFPEIETTYDHSDDSVKIPYEQWAVIYKNGRKLI